MTNIADEIKRLGPWYQLMYIDGIRTIEDGQEYSRNIAPDKIWENIKAFLPESMKGMRVLDLGANAGYHSVNVSLLGAKEVIGVEMNNIFYNQSLFYKKYIEKSLKKRLKIKFIKDSISDLDFNKLGKFDYVLALSIIYHIGKHKYGKYTEEAFEEQLRVLKIIAPNTKFFIVGTRNKKVNDINHYNGMFDKIDFKPLNTIVGGKRSWVLYGR